MHNTQQQDSFSFSDLNQSINQSTQSHTNITHKISIRYFWW